MAPNHLAVLSSIRWGNLLQISIDTGVVLRSELSMSVTYIRLNEGPRRASVCQRVLLSYVRVWAITDYLPTTPYETLRRSSHMFTDTL